VTRAVLEKWRAAFDQHIPFEKGWLGYGLNGVTNPVDSQNYGSGHWLLSEIKMGKDTTFLDLRINNMNDEMNYSFHFSENAKNELISFCHMDPADFTHTQFKLGTIQLNGA
jgi:hypothetical protein